MPSRRPEPGTPQEWLARAKGKLALARVPLPPDAYWEDLCYLAQQAAELAIKAVYQHSGWPLDLVHDLRHLLNGLKNRGLAVPPEVEKAARISFFAVQARYPGFGGSASKVQYDEAVQIAETVCVWAAKLIP